MSIDNTTYRLLVEKLGDSDPSQFVGNEGEVFYDPDAVSPTFKLSDGTTPGGVPFGSSGITSDFSYLNVTERVHIVGFGVSPPPSTGIELFVGGETQLSGSVSIAGNVNIVGVTTINGNLNAPGNYYVKLARITNQTITNGVDELIAFFPVSDTNGWYVGITTRTTPTVAGTYQVQAMLNWGAGANTNVNQCNIQIRKNGNTFAISQVGIQTYQYTMNACGIVTMNGTTDYIDFTAYTNNPTSQVVNGDAGGVYTKMEIFKIN